MNNIGLGTVATIVGMTASAVTWILLDQGRQDGDHASTPQVELSRNYIEYARNDELIKDARWRLGELNMLEVSGQPLSPDQSARREYLQGQVSRWEEDQSLLKQERILLEAEIRE